MGYRIVTTTPRGDLVTEIPIATEHAGPEAVMAFVAADVAAQVAARNRRTPAEKKIGATPEE